LNFAVGQIQNGKIQLLQNENQKAPHFATFIAKCGALLTI